MRAHYLPIAYAIVILMAMFVSYSIAVTMEHVPAVLPYISDTGVLAPERSVFSQLINMAVILQLMTFYVRYEQIKMALQSERSKHRTINRPSTFLMSLNRLCLWIGFAISLGMSLIGNFQLEASFEHRPPADQMGPGRRQELMSGKGEVSIEDKASTIVQKIHWTGAFLAFVGGLVWMTIQSWFSVKFCSCPPSDLSQSLTISSEEAHATRHQELQHLQIRRTNKCSVVDGECQLHQVEEASSEVASSSGSSDYYGHGCRARGMLRLALSLIGVALLMTGIVLAIIHTAHSETHNEVERHGGDVTNPSSQKDSHSLETWQGRISVSAAFCEWIITLLVVVYMLTLAPEFRSIRLGSFVKPPSINIQG